MGTRATLRVSACVFASRGVLICVGDPGRRRPCLDKIQRRWSPIAPAPPHFHTLVPHRFLARLVSRFPTELRSRTHLDKRFHTINGKQGLFPVTCALAPPPPRKCQSAISGCDEWMKNKRDWRSSPGRTSREPSSTTLPRQFMDGGGATPENLWSLTPSHARPVLST